MPGFLKSAYSDPVASAINTFSTLDEIAGRREERGQRRELMAQTAAEHRLRMEGMQRQSEAEQRRASAEEQLRKNLDLGDLSDDEWTNLKTNLPSAVQETEKATQEDRTPKYSEEQGTAVNTAIQNNKLLHDGDLAKKSTAIENILAFSKQALPNIKPGMKVRFDESKYPTFIQSIQEVYGDLVNTGSDKYGATVKDHGVSKKITSVYLDMTTNPPSMSFGLNVRTPTKAIFQPDMTGKLAAGQDEMSYDAPLTMQHSGDSKDPISQIPVEMAHMQLTQAQRLAKTALALKKYRLETDPAGYAKEQEQLQKQAGEGKARREAFAKLAEERKKRPDMSANEQREFILSALPDTMSTTDASKLASDIIKETTQTGLVSPAGKTMSDRSRLVAQYGENSDQVKQFDKLSEKPDKETDISLAGKEAAGDPKAKKTRALIQEGRIKVARESRTPKEPKQTEEEKAKLKTAPSAGEIDKRITAMKTEQGYTDLLPSQQKIARESVSKGRTVDEAIDEAKKKPVRTMADLYKMASQAGTSSKAVKALTAEGYSETQAKDIIKQGITGGYIK